MLEHELRQFGDGMLKVFIQFCDFADLQQQLLRHQRVALAQLNRTRSQGFIQMHQTGIGNFFFFRWVHF